MTACYLTGLIAGVTVGLAIAFMHTMHKADKT
jgi:hypothetical protein